MTRPKAYTKHFPNVKRQWVQGYFRVGGKIRRRVLATFEELDLDAAGDPLTPGSKAEKQRQAVLTQRYAEIFKELEARAPGPAGRGMRELMQDWIDAAPADRSPRTIEYYLVTANEYVSAVGDHAAGQFTVKQLQRFITWLKKPRQRSPDAPEYSLSTAAINIRLKCLGRFFTWAEAAGEIDRRPRVPLLRQERRLPRIPTPEQMAALYQRIVTQRVKHHLRPDFTRAYRHDLIYWYVARFTGARVGELVHLPRAALDFDARAIHVKIAGRTTIKERREKPLPMPPQLADFLRDDVDHHPGEVWLFDDGGVLTPEGIVHRVPYASPYAFTRKFNRHLHALGLGGQGIKATHFFRAYFATDLWKRGVDLAIIQQWLGHQSAAVTAGYFADPYARVRDMGVQIVDTDLGKPWKPQLENRANR